MPRNFGIEIEAIGLTTRAAAQAIHDAGIPCQAEAYNHGLRAHWKVVTDQSLSGGLGFEVVSPVLDGTTGYDQVHKVMEALRAAGAKVNKSCGLHVHIDAANLGLREFSQLAKNYLVWEDFFDLIMPPSRRGSENEYVKSLRRKFGGYDHAAARAGMEAVDRCSSIDEIISTVNGRNVNDRYFKLNLTAYWRHKTVEFRQHNGTLNAEKACQWISLVQTFVDKASTSRVRPRAATTTTVKPSVLFTQFYRMFGLKTTRAYFNGRRKHFARDAEEA